MQEFSNENSLYEISLLNLLSKHSTKIEKFNNLVANKLTCQSRLKCELYKNVYGIVAEKKILAKEIRIVR